MYCIIDACSYIYLSQFSYTVNEKEVSLIDLLRQTSTVKHCSIISDEIKRNITIDAKESMKIHNSIHDLPSNTYQQYDKNIFDNTLYTEDSGEKANMIIAVEIYKKQRTPIIYLSDDNKAIGNEGHLREIANALVFCKIWTSFDVINYLYFSENQSFDSERAKSAITDIVTFLFNPQRQQIMDRKGEMSNDEYSQSLGKLADKANKIKADSIKKIDLLSKIISINTR